MGGGASLDWHHHPLVLGATCVVPARYIGVSFEAAWTEGTCDLSASRT
jgi:hypothetical protein